MKQHIIRDLFIPVQPTLSKDSLACYNVIQPVGLLSPYINCYWQMKAKQPLTEDFIYRVVADGCIDVFWEASAPEQNFVMGLSSAYTEFPMSSQFNYLGIRFLPASFPILFKIDASDLTNRFEHLKLAVPKLSNSISNLCQGITALGNLKPILDLYFQKLISTHQINIDSRLLDALHIMLTKQGDVSLRDDFNIGISQRQLRRLFRQYIGESPKTFCKIIRFQNFLNAKPSKASLQHNKLFYNLGYYDQAHFIKEFKHLYGSTPGVVFGR